MSRTRKPLPPGDVRLLAACSHLGPYIAFSLMMWMEIGSGIFPSGDVLDERNLRVAALQALTIISLLGPPAAALWAARSSPWRGFLRSHGSRALVFQSAGMLGILVVTATEDRIPSPQVVGLAVGLVGSLVVAALVLAWLILPVGAAFRAKDGDLAWYPLVSRLFPDPPEPGWRTPLPPASP
jgi:uncharacterized Tic20 family protein